MKIILWFLVADPLSVGWLLGKNPASPQAPKRAGVGQCEVEFVQGEDWLKVTTSLHLEPETLVITGSSGFPLAPYVTSAPYQTDSRGISAFARMWKTPLKGNFPEEATSKCDPHMRVRMQIPNLRLSSGWRNERVVGEVAAALGFVPSEGSPCPSPIYLYGSWDGGGLVGQFADLSLEIEGSIDEIFQKIVTLVRVLSSDRHYPLSEDDVKAQAKLMEGWISSIAPSMRARIVHSLTDNRKQRQLLDASLPPSEVEPQPEREEDVGGKGETVTLYQRRVEVTAEQLIPFMKGDCLIADLGCGGGRFLRMLAPLLPGADTQNVAMIGMEPLGEEREWFRRNQKRSAPGAFKRATVVRGAVGFKLPAEIVAADLFLFVEVIEHLPPNMVDFCMQALREQLGGKHMLITTPNREYNAAWNLEGLRHWDHTFEWTREEFGAFLTRLEKEGIWQVCKVFGVDQENSESEKYGAPTQGAVVCFCPPDPWAREPLLELPSKVVLESWLRTKGAPWDLPCVPATIPPPSGSIMRSLREESADHPAHQLLEHPEAAFRYYESVGVDRVVVEYKYMGSRMIASSQDGKEWKFHSRAGMRFFRPEQEAEFLERAKPTLDTLVQRYGTPILLDGELMPWSLKARGLIEDTFGPVAALASHAEKHRPDLYEERRLKHLVAYRNQLNIFGASSEVHYRVWNVRTPALDKARKSLMIGDPDRTFREELACLLGDEGAIRGISDYTVWLDQPFGRKLVARSFVEGRFLLSAAPDLEGFVVKPMPSMRQRRSTAEADLKVMQGLETNSIAPAIKVRRPEYLRLIYGPEYPDYLGRLQNRSVGRKMAQASNETRMAEKALKAWYEGDRYACAEACLRLHSLDDGSLDPRL